MIPRLPNCFASSFDASASSCGISVGSISMIVTSLPKRWKIDANSQPMMPPPSTTSRFGTSVCASSPSESTHAVGIEALDRRTQRERARRDDRLLEGDVLPALDGDRVRVLERAGALDPLDAVRLEERGDAGRHLLDDAVLPLVRLAEFELEAAELHAELVEGVLGLLQRERGLHPGFRRDAPDTKAGAAELGLTLDAGDLRAELRSPDRGRVTTWPSSENGDVDFHQVDRIDR